MGRRKKEFGDTATCNRCHETKPVSKFNRRRTDDPRPRPTCKACEQELYWRRRSPAIVKTKERNQAFQRLMDGWR